MGNYTYFLDLLTFDTHILISHTSCNGVVGLCLLIRTSFYIIYNKNCQHCREGYLNALG